MKNPICYILGHDDKGEKNKVRDWHNKCSRCKSEWNPNWNNTRFADSFWNSEVWDFLKLVIPIILVALGILVAIIGIGYLLDKNSCNAYSTMGIDVIYNFWTGCMANHPKFGYIPIEEYFRTLNLYIP